MKNVLFTKIFASLTLVMAFSLMPQQSDAQSLNDLVRGAKALKGAAKGAAAKSKYEPLKEKAETALQNGDLAYLISEECMVELPAQGNNLTGNAAEEWHNLYSRILGVFYVELHTIDQAGFCENVETLIGKAQAAETVQMQALYVDAAIGVMKAMISYNYDVKGNRAAVDKAYASVKAEWDKLPDSYKPVTVAEGADIHDPRFLHNLKGGVPDADFIIAYQDKIKEAQAEELAKKEAAANAEKERRLAMFEGGSSSCSFYVNVQKPGVSNVEKVDIANISSGSSSFNINEKNGTSSIGKFVLNGDEYEVYKGSSLIGYISKECKFYDRNRNYLGELTSGGNAYDKNGYTLGEISSSTVKLGSSYKWNSSSSINTKLFPAAVFLFFNSDFASYINVKDYYL